MRRIAKFHKVVWHSLQGRKDTFPTADEKEILSVYENIRLPLRATAGSAGYDFFAPVDITLAPEERWQYSYWYPRGNGTGLGTEMLPEKRTWIQIPSAVK